MSEQEADGQAPGTAAERPRRPDGKFMSKEEIASLENIKKDRDSHLEQNNVALMKTLGLNETLFKGMKPKAINTFLLNKINEKQASPPSSPPSTSNTPIIGTPVGSGRPKLFIDQFLTIDPKAHSGKGAVEFEAPASIVFQQHNNQKEAEQKWLDRQ